ncbi:hypothetical protein CEXT_219011 [Caerostris extrusa]|uniref:Uncharacterized protein n=1 Tax=Caerostris extrusa TaxID=172846 RepID=A0AAV4WVU2_CAEEX|nr:hypothetical protein CEXT_219011 [Caerostris extrusa]
MKQQNHDATINLGHNSSVFASGSKQQHITSAQWGTLLFLMGSGWKGLILRRSTDETMGHLFFFPSVSSGQCSLWSSWIVFQVYVPLPTYCAPFWLVPF